MAIESFAFNIAEKVLEKIASHTYQEICFAWGLKAELRKLEDILLTVKAVLMDAEEKQVNDPPLRLWLAKLKDALYDAEDVLDEFQCEDQRRRVLQLYGTTSKKVGHFFSCSNPIAFRFKMSAKVKQIRERLDEIASQKSKFHLTERYASGHVMPRERAPTHSFVQASEVIGRYDDKENIIRLLQDSSEVAQISIIPIVGIGGLGKTLLTKFVYNDERVRSHFQLQIWVCVSEEFDIKILTEKIIKSTEDRMRHVEKLKKLEMEQLQRILRETIGDKKYLLILDDVWNDDPMKWNQLKELLCMGASGSKILVTTRSNKVASIMGTIPKAYELSGLPEDECVALFTKCAFKEGQVKRYPNLLKIGVEIVKKCKGVPLAVKTLASLLLLNSDESYWKSIRDSELWKIEQKETDILPALRLSYEQLPVHLKKCFAYCSFYPKDYEFLDLTLIQFWMAHGLIGSANQDEEPEAIGLRYFQELGSRSFFQDFTGSDSLGISCKMHDLVHDLALSLTKNEFLAITSRTRHISHNVRHLLFPNSTSLPQDLSTLLQGLDHVRTAIFQSDKKSPSSQSDLDSYLLRFQYLRMLDLADSKLEISLDWIGALKHLRYLHLHGNSRIKKLPNSICKLYNLQTLRICEGIEELPSDIRYLINLRYLVVSTKQKCLPMNGIGCLTSLRFLGIANCEILEHLFEDMQGLKHLRTLVIYDCESLISLPQSMKYLTALENLAIVNCENLNLTLEENGKDDKHFAQFNLQKLMLKELPKLVDFPEWLLQGSSNALRFLKLENCEYIKELPVCIQNTASLQQLEIKDCDELSKRCERGKGEDWSKIAHIPKIVINGSDIDSSDD
ncbi:putative disease resistance protein RGA1 isoform X2 [Manihot esculenta]|uniref:putative disease resistance protein RGA1 isoform X2 n=1 Tax=Manihot esculenta TaxID=3983 RepID=UPI001CC7672A|nr:putative disease resistance protein RGA1 isoform X2 [Manihot esculenta]